MMRANLLQKFIDAYMNKVYEEKLEELMEDLKHEDKNKDTTTKGTNKKWEIRSILLTHWSIGTEIKI